MKARNDNERLALLAEARALADALCDAYEAEQMADLERRAAQANGLALLTPQAE